MAKFFRQAACMFILSNGVWKDSLEVRNLEHVKDISILESITKVGQKSFQVCAGNPNYFCFAQDEGMKALTTVDRKSELKQRFP